MSKYRSISETHNCLENRVYERSAYWGVISEIDGLYFLDGREDTNPIPLRFCPFCGAELMNTLDWLDYAIDVTSKTVTMGDVTGKPSLLDELVAARKEESVNA